MIHGKKLALVAAIAALISAPALAGNPDRSKLDTNRDGKVDYAEMKAGNSDLTQADFDRLDKNRDGALGDDEWSGTPGKGHAYGAVDADNDGSYSIDEVRSTNPGVSESEYRSYDTNKDGKVSKDELKAVTDKPKQ